MQNTPAKPPRSRLWKYARRFLITIVVLVTLVAALWIEENIRGKHAWLKYKAELEAKGEKLDLKDFIPPTVPADQNFAMTPLLAGLYDFVPDSERKPGQSLWRDANALSRAAIIKWSGNPSNPVPDVQIAPWMTGQMLNLNVWASFFRGATNTASTLRRLDAAAEVLRGLKQFQAQMDELETASHRQFCRFNIAYDNENPAAILLPHLAVLKSQANVFRLRASAQVAVGQTAESLKDIEMAFYLSDVVKDPTLISYLVRIAICGIALQPVWEGLAEHKWSDAQLVELQLRLGKYDLLADYNDALHGERAFSLAILEFQRTHRDVDVMSDDAEASGSGSRNYMPSGFFYQNAVSIVRMHEEILFQLSDPAMHRIRRDKFPTEPDAFKTVSGFYRYKVFAALLLPSLQGSAQKFAATQTKIDQALVACALERYRLKNGAFPDSLDALKPQFIGSIPNDVINGKPLNYRRKDDGNFILYSVGWNEKDDGGTVVTIGKSENKGIDLNQGDWVWPEYPPK
jgi:hypothetical protein